ncbi:MBL fold metallo-hydrolase [Rahnella aceris]|uniref:MBL fold metallo-hydrolase n=1 Tax=Rahnella sp. (strain Y9602) TaxID=2703885 RepID=UPI001C265DF8|nr:MBL fold metallo-hydrolase [Rahnella aceris]MBU9860980.1 MBL fold metallo-hydrolase [Rahnella aceris]
MSSIIPTLPADSFEIITFGVGHGDCHLVELHHHGKVAFRLLYDGGVSLPQALTDHLNDHKKEDGSEDLDVVVLSHIDHDHQGGFHSLLKKTDITIGELWLPCLPAFERLSWLFAPRVQDAVSKAKGLENEANTRKIPVIYPLEGYKHRFQTNGNVTVSVISPARKMIKRLYSAPYSELETLLAHESLPHEWLIRGESWQEEEQFSEAANVFDTMNALSRDNFSPVSNQDNNLRNQNNIGQRIKKYRDNTSEPNFFGNSVLNDTSLVIVIDALLDGSQRRRIVLTGDQENWSWICSEYPAGLGVDVLKAPHHGGRVYLSDNKPKDRDDLDQFYIWMRPRIAVVSAKGTHNLPRQDFREALRAVGTTLVCPNTRTKEFIFNDISNPLKKSCFEHFACNSQDQTKALRVRMTALQEDVNTAACLQGNCHRGAAPIVVLQQKIIEPDESFVRWTQTEVRKNAEWLEKLLMNDRKNHLKDWPESERLDHDVEAVKWSAIHNQAEAEQRTAFAFDPSYVLKYAAVHGIIWGSEDLKYGSTCDLVAAISDTEYKNLLNKVKEYSGFLLKISMPDSRSLHVIDNIEILESAEFSVLMEFWSAWAYIPYEIFIRHVKPRLLRDIAKHYSASIVNNMDPHFPISTNAKNSYATLYLYNNKAVSPDFYEKNSWYRLDEKLTGYISAHAFMAQMEQSKGSVLPILNYSHRGYTPDLSSLERFVKNFRDLFADEEEEKSNYPKDFETAPWLKLWGKDIKKQS